MDEIEYTHSLNLVQLQGAANLLHKYSWGRNDSSPPIAEILQSELHVAAVVGADIIGYAGVYRFVSPDGVDESELWFVHAVVRPDYRRRGIWTNLYQMRLGYVRHFQNRVLCCTNNPSVKRSLLSKGWADVSQAVDKNNGSSVAKLELIDRSR